MAGTAGRRTLMTAALTALAVLTVSGCSGSAQVSEPPAAEAAPATATVTVTEPAPEEDPATGTSPDQAAEPTADPTVEPTPTPTPTPTPEPTPTAAETTEGEVGEGRPSEGATAEPTPTVQTEGTGGAPWAGDAAGYADVWTFDSGIRVSLTPPEAYTPDPSAAGGGTHPEFVVFTVRVENEAAAPFRPGDGLVGVESLGGAGTLVIDSANGAYGGPWGEIAPGEAQEQVYAFGVDDADDVYVHVETGYGADSPVRFGPR